MSLNNPLKSRIIRDASISILIYALPVILMFAWFAYKGEKPWLKPSKTVQSSQNKLNF